MKHRSNSAPAALLALAALLPGAVLAQAADTDGDGAVDSSDVCPNTAAGTLVDRKGCAAIIPPLPADEFPEATAEAVAAASAAAPQATPPPAAEAAAAPAAAATAAMAAEPIAPAPVEPAPQAQQAALLPVSPPAAEPAPVPPAPEPVPAPAPAPAPAPVPVAVVELPAQAPPLSRPSLPAASSVPLPPGVSLLPAATPSQDAAPAPSLASVSFDIGSAKLSGPARKQLDAVLSALRARPDLQLEIIGHSAAGESAGLAAARAAAVKAFLSDLGVAGSRLKTRGKAGGAAEVEFRGTAQ